MADFICPECGTPFQAPPSWGKKFCSRKCSGASLSRRYKGKKPSPQCLAAVSRANRIKNRDPAFIEKMKAGVRRYWDTHPGPNAGRFGEANYNWQGGISFEPYSADFNDHLKERIRKRDDYQCQLCGLSQEKHLQQYGRRLSIHHIDYDKQNSDSFNLITLCFTCNSRANGDREYHTALFSEHNEHRGLRE